ncbi:cytochrome P450 [Zopfia rhizophila CBS 207.26]|uniref:Cytochrome P450 n=1 Tax=Zopfia rhizophila CBS 207.26 TaxID=1314779 RepID=A0A6A6DY89_9PEZI|nr:cytochrome P450 [Zopfia rhizophila CBS 207.26]
MTLPFLEQPFAEIKGNWSSESIRSASLVFILLTFTLYKTIHFTQWARRRQQFLDFARTNNCANPPRITGSFISGISHKWKRLHQPGDMFNDYMNNIFHDSGPTHAIVEPFTGDTKTIYTIEPENVKTMLSTKFSNYYRPKTMPNALNPVMGQGVFTSNGAAWSHSRSLVRAQFSTKRIRNVAKLDVHVRNIYEALGEELEDGWTEEQEILPIFNRFTLDAATEFMFGTSAESHEAAMREKALLKARKEEQSSHWSQRFWTPLGYIGQSGFSSVGQAHDFWARNSLIMSDFGTAFDIALDYVALRLKLGRLWFLADGFSFRLACHKVKTFADSYIQDAAAHADAAKATARKQGMSKKNATDVNGLEPLDDRRYGLISELIDSYPDKVALRNQVMQLLVAGRDTTAATLTWSLILLEAHPHIFSRLRKALLEGFGSESKPIAPVTFENLRSCIYLQWVVSEVVRLYPTGPLNARKASNDTILPIGGGPDGKAPVAVKAGTTVAYNTYLMHRREDLWGSDSWEFRPERWEGKKAGWEYIPFHGGPQTCLGQQHALTEMAYVLTRMLQRYDRISSSTRETNLKNGIRTILVPKHSVCFQFRRSAD